AQGPARSRVRRGVTPDLTAGVVCTYLAARCAPVGDGERVQSCGAEESHHVPVEVELPLHTGRSRRPVPPTGNNNENAGGRIAPAPCQERYRGSPAACCFTKCRP